MSAELNRDGSYPLSRLQLDMTYDIYSGEIPGAVSLYLYAEELSWEKVAQAALGLDSLFVGKSDFLQTNISVVLKPLSAKEGRQGEYLGVYEFPRELLQSDDLPEVMEQHYRLWEEKSSRDKGLELQYRES